MKTFQPLDDSTVQTREAQWPSYAGEKIEMRHGFALELRANCDYSRRRFVYRIAEHHEINFLVNTFTHSIDQEWVCIDVGANIGYWSKLLAEILDVGKVFAFEPDPVTFKILQRNLEANSNVEVIEAALGSQKGKLSLYVDPSDSGDSTGNYVDGRNRVDVNMSTLDTFMEERGITRIDFLKVDIQGGEIDFFKGAEFAIKTMRPLILVEIMGDTYKGISQFIADFALKNNYEIYLINEDQVLAYDPEELALFSGNSNAFLVPK
jgi:FkbM family methyltransferase